MLIEWSKLNNGNNLRLGIAKSFKPVYHNCWCLQMSDANQRLTYTLTCLIPTCREEMAHAGFQDTKANSKSHGGSEQEHVRDHVSALLMRLPAASVQPSIQIHSASSKHLGKGSGTFAAELAHLERPLFDHYRDVQSPSSCALCLNQNCISQGNPSCD